MNTKQRAKHTIDSLLARTVEVGDCMEWQGYTANNSPQVSKNGKMITVRKLIRQLQGVEVAKGTFTSAKCGNPKCVNPEHFTDRTMKQHAKFMSGRIDFQSPIRIAKLQKSAQPRRKISVEGVAAALGDQRSCAAVADEFGVHKSLISKIRRGVAHRQVSSSVNPFAGLMR